LDYILNNAIIIDEDKGNREIVEIGATVTIQEGDYEPETYFLVGAKEADPRNGRISNESPFGKALLGAKKGETVSAETPGGTVKLKILKIA